MFDYNRYEIDVYGKRESVLEFGRILRGEHPTIVSLKRVFIDDFEDEQDIGEGVFLGLFEGEVIGDIMEPLHDGEVDLVLTSILNNPMRIEGGFITIDSFNKLIESISLARFAQQKKEEEFSFQRKLERNVREKEENLFSIASGKGSILADILKLTEELNLRVEIKNYDYYGSFEKREVLFENGTILKHTVESLNIIVEEDEEESHSNPIWSLDQM